MRTGDESTAACHRDTIADLRARLAASEAYSEKLRNAIETLADLYGSERVTIPFVTVVTKSPEATVQNTVQSGGIAGLGLSEACVRIIRDATQPITNREILNALNARGFAINSDNPLNNVGSSLKHRAKTKGDIQRTGKHWGVVGKKETPRSETNEGPAMNGAYHTNGAVAPTT